MRTGNAPPAAEATAEAARSADDSFRSLDSNNNPAGNRSAARHGCSSRYHTAVLDIQAVSAGIVLPENCTVRRKSEL
jgi:hypothetical protein